MAASSTPLILLLSTLLQQGGKVALDCDTGSTIRGAMSRVHSGDTLVVTGTCKENVVISTQKAAHDRRFTACCLHQRQGDHNQGIQEFDKTCIDRLVLP